MKLNKRQIGIIIGIPISIVFLYLAFRKVDFNKTWSLLKSANVYLIILAVIATFGDFTLRTLRWKLLLSPIKKCKFINLMSIVYISFLANNTLPMRAGEVIRIIFVGEKENIPKTGAAATLAVERLLDIFSIILLAVSTIFLYKYPDRIKKVLIIFSVLLIFTVMLLYGLLYNKNFVLSILNKIFKLLPEKFEKKATGMFHSFMDGLEILKQTQYLFRTILLSILIWLLNSSVFFLAAKSMDINGVTYTGGIFIMAIVSMGISIPSSPGFIGVYEYFGKLAAGVLGVGESAAVGFILLAHFIQFSVINITGLLFLGREHMSFLQLKKKTKKEI
ncbi:MAG: lysylphosphatidylglycerol synthase transmembrane domain-containing protein [Elusimicrobiota bacterium]